MSLAESGRESTTRRIFRRIMLWREGTLLGSLDRKRGNVTQPTLKHSPSLTPPPSLTRPLSLTPPPSFTPLPSLTPVLSTEVPPNGLLQLVKNPAHYKFLLNCLRARLEHYVQQQGQVCHPCTLLASHLDRTISVESKQNRPQDSSSSVNQLDCLT
jgi:hypothetical protein